MNSSSVVTPPTRENAVNASPSPPCTSPSRPTGSPSMSFAMITPHRNAGTRLPPKAIQSQNARHRAPAAWLRLSEEAPARRPPADGHPLPERAPPVAVDLVAVLEGDPTQQQGQQDQHEQRVEAAEDRAVPDGEGGEHHPGGRDDPHLVAVPERPDRAGEGPPPGVGACQRGPQDVHAEVEALEEEVEGERQRDQPEPQRDEVHRQFLLSYSWNPPACS